MFFSAGVSKIVSRFTLQTNKTADSFQSQQDDFNVGFGDESSD